MEGEVATLEELKEAHCRRVRGTSSKKIPPSIRPKAEESKVKEMKFERSEDVE